MSSNLIEGAVSHYCLSFSRLFGNLDLGLAHWGLKILWLDCDTEWLCDNNNNTIYLNGSSGNRHPSYDVSNSMRQM